MSFATQLKWHLKCDILRYSLVYIYKLRNIKNAIFKGFRLTKLKKKIKLNFIHLV